MVASRHETQASSVGLRGCVALLVLVGSMGIASTAAAVSKEEKGADVSSTVDIEQLRSVLEDLEERAATWSSGAEGDVPETPAAVVESVGRDAGAAELYRWVRERVAFEPYEGPLRGPEHVLAVGAANAVDQARLLAALYRRAEVDHRLVRGRLPRGSSAELLGEFAGRVEDATTHSGAASSLMTEAPAYVREGQLERVRDHVWIEVEREDGSYVAADPVAAETYGETPAEVEARGEPIETAFRAAVVATLEGGAERALITIETGFERIAYRPIHVTVEESRVEGTVLPRVHVGGRTEAGDRFVPSKVRRLALEFELVRGDRMRRVERRLFDDRTGRGNFRADHTVATAMLVPGWTNEAVVRAEAGDAVRRRTETARGYLERDGSGSAGATAAGLDAALRAVGALGVFARSLHADALAGRIGASTGVRPVRTSSRVVLATERLSSKGLGLAVESRGGRLEPIPARGIEGRTVEAFRTLYGFAVDELEAGLVEKVTGTSVPSTRELVVRARRMERGPVTVLDGMDGGLSNVRAPEGVSAALAETVRGAGRVAVAPGRPVEMSGRMRFGWWSIEPNGGMIRGRPGRPRVGFSTRLPARSGDATLSGALERGSRVLSAGLEGQSNYRKVVCGALSHAESGLRSACRADRHGSLPSTESCTAGATESDAARTGPAGIVSIGANSCSSRLRDARCGASVAQTLLAGQIRFETSFAGDSGVVPTRGVHSSGAGAVRCGGS